MDDFAIVTFVAIFDLFLGLFTKPRALRGLLRNEYMLINQLSPGGVGRVERVSSSDAQGSGFEPRFV